MLFGSSGLPFATSQSCRKSGILSPDPCSPMTQNGSLPTLFSLELLNRTEDHCPTARNSPRPSCQNRPRHMLLLLPLECWGPNRTSSLMTIGSFFRRKKKSSPCGHTSPGHSSAWRLWADAHCPKRPAKGHRTSSHNGCIRPDTTLLPGHCCLASTRPRANFKYWSSTHFRDLSRATTGSSRSSSHCSSRVLFLPKNVIFCEPDLKTLPFCPWLLSWPTGLCQCLRQCLPWRKPREGTCSRGICQRRSDDHVINEVCDIGEMFTPVCAW